MHAIAEVQRLGGNCAFVDAEHAFDSEYARVSWGVGEGGCERRQESA
jgi:RecA/RadA recombinase